MIISLWNLKSGKMMEIREEKTIVNEKGEIETMFIKREEPCMITKEIKTRGINMTMTTITSLMSPNKVVLGPFLERDQDHSLHPKGLSREE